MKQIKHCLKCGTTKEITRHHVLPVRHYGRTGNRMVVHICQEDHRKLELLISRAERKYGAKPRKRSKQFYIDCLVKFLQYPKGVK